MASANQALDQRPTEIAMQTTDFAEAANMFNAEDEDVGDLAASRRNGDPISAAFYPKSDNPHKRLEESPLFQAIANQRYNSTSGGTEESDVQSPVSLNMSTSDYSDVPDCEVKSYLLEIGRMMSRSDEVTPVLRTVIKENWLETIAHLEALSEADWAHLGIPRQFLRMARNHLREARSLINRPGLSAPPNAPKPGATAGRSYDVGSFLYCPTDSVMGDPALVTGEPVEEFVKKICQKYSISPADCTATVKCLMEENWFDSLDQLRELTPQQWRVLKLPPGMADKLSAAVIAGESQSGEEIVIAAAASMGKSAAQVQPAIEKLRGAGLTTSDSLSNVSDSSWTDLGLPLRLLEAIRRVLGSSGSTSLPVVSHLTGQYPSHLMTSEEGARSPSAGPDPRIVRNKQEREEKMITVDKLLLKVGLSVGKSEEEMKPVIAKIVKENWFDDIKTLRTLSQEDWQLLGLPKRLVESVRKSLEDPFMLEMNLVQFTQPEPELFPSDVYSAVWKLEAEVPPDQTPDTLRALLRLMETLVCNPFDESKRVIRKANTNFRKKAGGYKSAILVLETVGYEDAGDSFVLPVAYMARITEAHAALAQLAQTYRDRLRKVTKPPKDGLFSAIKRG